MRERSEADTAPPTTPSTAARAPRRRLPGHDRRELAAIFAGGILGALARTGLEQTAGRATGTWPWVTFAVNIAGAFLLGYSVTRLQERLPPSSYPRPFIGTGVCGALSTFSTMQLELYDMVERGRWLLAGGYAASTLLTGFLALALATALVRRARVLA